MSSPAWMQPLSPRYLQARSKAFAASTLSPLSRRRCPALMQARLLSHNASAGGALGGGATALGGALGGSCVLAAGGAFGGGVGGGSSALVGGGSLVRVGGGLLVLGGAAFAIVPAT